MNKRPIDELNDNKLTESLKGGETLLWQGASEKFSATGGERKKTLVTRIIICAVVFAVLVAGYAAMVSSLGTSFSPVLCVLLFAACGYVAIMPILACNKVMNKCSYYVTDSRVAAVIDGKEVCALNRKNVNVKFIPAENGCVDILLGSCVNLPENKYVNATIVPAKNDSHDEVVGLVFYNVKDSKRLRELLGEEVAA